MELRKTLTLDGVDYVMTPVNAVQGWSCLQKLLGAIGRSKMMNGGDGSMATAIALAFSLMDGKELVEGALYQFEDFFTGIRATLGSLFPGMESVMAFLAKAREVAGEADASLPKTEAAPTGSSGHPSSGSSPASPS